MIAQKTSSDAVQQCVNDFIDFCLLSQYHSHTDDTIHLLTIYWKSFLKSVHVFRSFRPQKDAQKKSTAFIRKAMKTLEKEDTERP